MSVSFSKVLQLTCVLLGPGLSIPAEESTPAFPNGVAAGDVTTTSAVLWARIRNLGTVTFEYATNAEFEPLAGAALAEVLDANVPVKVEINDLLPATEYSYRVTDAKGNSMVGRFRTAAPPGVFNGLRFGVSGDWRGELSPYPSVANADERDLDFFVALGDTIYADVPSPAVPDGRATTLPEFRAKHSEVYSEKFGLNALGDLRGSTAIFATIDDHEVVNDFAGGAPLESDSRFGSGTLLINETDVFREAMQAFEEYNPIRELRYDTPDDPRTHEKIKLYRTQRYGRDAAIFLLDARSFRDEGIANVTNPLDLEQVERFDALSFDRDPATGEPLPRRTMLGRTQLEDLKTDLRDAQWDGVIWKFVIVPEPIQSFGFIGGASDRFEGYATERTELLKFIDDHEIENVVFIAADFHGTVVNNILYQLGPGEPQIPTGAFEVVTGSVAYHEPFGPTTFNLAEGVDVLPGTGLLALLLSSVGIADRAAFDALPIREKDAAYKRIGDLLLITIGLNPTGLEDSAVDAELIEGGYVAVHTYGWTEFEMDPTSHELTVTTYGIEPYSPEEVDASIVDRVPEIVSQFRVQPRIRPFMGPKLTAIRNNDQLQLTWPVGASNYTLQSVAALEWVTEWTDENALPAVLDGQNVVTLDVATERRFYRLINR